MDFSKPQILIDIDEYEHLKAIEADSEQSDSIVYQKALGNIVDLMPNRTRDDFFSSLHAAGIAGVFIPAFSSQEDPKCVLKKMEA